MNVVFSLGGSVIVPDELDVDFLKKFCNLINKYKKKNRFSIVCGGGKTARVYANRRAELGLSDKEAHEVGIMATHLNAFLIAKLVKGKFTTEHPFRIGKKRGLYVSGGYKPGWTTDTDAAYIAKGMKADMVINVTNVKGVYDKNPKKYKNAKFIPKLNWKRFFEIMGRKVVPSGSYVFDPIAAGVCQRNKIKVVITYADVNNIKQILDGKRFNGTILS